MSPAAASPRSPASGPTVSRASPGSGCGSGCPITCAGTSTRSEGASIASETTGPLTEDTPSSRLVRWASTAAIALPAVIVLLFVQAHAVNVPYWDEWESVPDILAAHLRRLTIADLWRQHNEHRIFFPRV